VVELMFCGSGAETPSHLFLHCHVVFICGLRYWIGSKWIWLLFKICSSILNVGVGRWGTKSFERVGG